MTPVIPKVALTSLIHRLEAATSRLEDMASSAIEPPKLNGSAAPSPAPVAPLPATPMVMKAAPLPEPLPESVEDFDTFLSGPFKKFVNLSDELGGAVSEQVSRGSWRSSG